MIEVTKDFEPDPELNETLEKYTDVVEGKMGEVPFDISVGIKIEIDINLNIEIDINIIIEIDISININTSININKNIIIDIKMTSSATGPWGVQVRP